MSAREDENPPAASQAAAGEVPAATAQPGAGSAAQQNKIAINIAPELDYVYRDIFNVLVSAEDVVIEFGTRHRSLRDSLTIANRIVMPMSAAIGLRTALDKNIREMADRIEQQRASGQAQMKQQKNKAAESEA